MESRNVTLYSIWIQLVTYPVALLFTEYFFISKSFIWRSFVFMEDSSESKKFLIWITFVIIREMYTYLAVFPLQAAPRKVISYLGEITKLSIKAKKIQIKNKQYDLWLYIYTNVQKQSHSRLVLNLPITLQYKNHMTMPWLINLACYGII